MKFVARFIDAFPLFSSCFSTETFASLQLKSQPLLPSQTLTNQKLDNIQLTKLTQSLELIDLELGMKESQVGQLQLVLKHYGYYLENVDNYFGHKTQLAISNLQQDLGFENHGRFDGATWYALNFWLPYEH